MEARSEVPDGRVVLIGQAPSRTSDPSTPLTGAFGRRVAELMGIEFQAYLRRFDRRNVLDRWFGKNGKGDKFPLPLAMMRAREMKVGLVGRRVVFFGRNTAAAFEFCGEYLRWCKKGGFTAAVFPHPSGINRWWNDAENARRGREFLRRIAS